MCHPKLATPDCFLLNALNLCRRLLPGRLAKEAYCEKVVYTKFYFCRDHLIPVRLCAHLLPLERRERMGKTAIIDRRYSKRAVKTHGLTVNP